MPFQKTIPFVCLLFIFYACEKLPKDRPYDCVVELHEAGGMLPVSSDIILRTSDSSSIALNVYGANMEEKFMLTETEADTLYKVFQDQEFINIKATEKDRVMDRGGTSIVLQYGATILKKSNAGNSFVDTKWQANFQTVENTIRFLAKQKMDAAAPKVTVTLDSSLWAMDKQVILTINFTSLARYLYNSETDGVQAIHTMPLPEGSNYIQLDLMNPPDEKGRPNVFASGQFRVLIDKERTALRFYVENGEVLYE